MKLHRRISALISWTTFIVELTYFVLIRRSAKRSEEA